MGLVRRDEVEQHRALRDAAQVQPTVTRSELQQTMLDLVRRVGLPAPRTEARIGPCNRVLRFTWRQLTTQSEIVAARLAAALALSASAA